MNKLLFTDAERLKQKNFQTSRVWVKVSYNIAQPLEEKVSLITLCDFFEVRKFVFVLDKKVCYALIKPLRRRNYCFILYGIIDVRKNVIITNFTR